MAAVVATPSSPHKRLKVAEDTSADAAASSEVALERSLGTSGLGAAKAVEGQVPIIDMAQGDDACAQGMWRAATEVGFFIVKNHGIPEADIDEAFSLSSRFFGQDRETKEAQCEFASKLNSGYEYMKQVRPSTGTADQKESLQITARSGSMDGRWPSTPPGFEAKVKTFMDKTHALGCRILSLLEPMACPKIKAGTLAGAHTLWADDGQCTMRMLHYPPVEPETVPPNYWRAGPHTDWCCCTLLFQRPGNEGLECAPNPKVVDQTSGAPWLKVDPIAGGIAVNIGDMLGRWSDGRLLSNLHRVRMPTPEECTPPRSRYSRAFFMQADKHVVIESERTEAITAGDYILGRIRSNFAK